MAASAAVMRVRREHHEFFPQHQRKFAFAPATTQQKQQETKPTGPKPQKAKPVGPKPESRRRAVIDEASEEEEEVVVDAEEEQKVRVAEQNTVERRAHGERLKDAGEPGAVVPELLSRAKTEAEAEAEVARKPAAVVSGTSVVSHTSQTVDACDACEEDDGSGNGGQGAADSKPVFEPTVLDARTWGRYWQYLVRTSPDEEPQWLYERELPASLLARAAQ